jgi:hypothetical protein
MKFITKTKDGYVFFLDGKYKKDKSRYFTLKEFIVVLVLSLSSMSLFIIGGIVKNEWIMILGLSVGLFSAAGLSNYYIPESCDPPTE